MVVQGQEISTDQVGIGGNLSLLNVCLLDSKGILEKYRKVSFSYLWRGKKENQVIPWVRWERIANLKALGGWGLKNIFLFSKSLAAKSVWRLISTKKLWTKVVI